MAKNSPQDLKNREYFSNNLNHIMKEKGIRQIDLHNALEIPKSTITGYVKGRSMPTSGNLQKLADYLGVKKSYLDLRFINNNLDEIARDELSKFYKDILAEGVNDLLARFIMAEMNDIYFNPEKQHPSKVFSDQEQFLVDFTQRSITVKNKWLKMKKVNYYVMDRLKHQIAESFTETKIILNNHINNSDEYLIHGLDESKIPQLLNELTSLESETLEKIKSLELNYSNALG